VKARNHRYGLFSIRFAARDRQPTSVRGSTMSDANSRAVIVPISLRSGEYDENPLTPEQREFAVFIGRALAERWNQLQAGNQVGGLSNSVVDGDNNPSIDTKLGLERE
jgi:hypothetical protein